MSPPGTPYQPYAQAHSDIQGPGDARPTAMQIVDDCDAFGKLILLTGCSGGIGVETARALYETGARLFLMARNLDKLDKAIEDIVSHARNESGPRPQSIEMHLESLESVRKAAKIFKTKSGDGKLNKLICNGGVMTSPLGKTREGFETHLGVNYLAHFLLFHLLKPNLLSSARDSNTTSCVIMVSSSAHVWSGIHFPDMS